MHSGRMWSGGDADALGRIEDFVRCDTEGTRQLSFGWDWCWDPQTRLMLADWRHLRTNALVVDDCGRSLTAAETYPYVEQLLSACQWQAATCRCLGL